MSRYKTRPSGSRREHTAIPLQDLDKKWQPVFRMFDPDERQEVTLFHMKQVLTDPSMDHGIPEETVEYLLQKADKDRNGKINYEEFVAMIRDKEYEALRRPLMQRALWAAAYSVIPKNQRATYRRRYMDEYSCIRNPPLFMFSISLIELGIFIYHSIHLVQIYGFVGPNGPAPTNSTLIYNPFKRHEAWRFGSYMFVHSGYMHIVFNVLVQLVLGIPLELVHQWWRILIVYLAGVVGGSLATSITDPYAYLAGASGGVYALIAAHLASVVLNWSEMEFAIVRVLGFGLFAVVDVGVAIYYRHMGVDTHIGYVAHFAGAVSGLLVGVVVLRNLQKLKWEKIVSIICLTIYVILMLVGIGWNVFFPDHFPMLKY